MKLYKIIPVGQRNDQIERSFPNDREDSPKRKKMTQTNDRKRAICDKEAAILPATNISENSPRKGNSFH